MTKGCSHHHHERRRLFLRISAAILAFIILILFIIFLIWIILRPRSPSFILQDATLYVFNLSSSEPSPTYPTPYPTLSLNMQVSLSAHNPNDRIGVFYGKLDAYASYRGQQISQPTALPPTYQGHNDFTVWSPFLLGTAVTVPPYAVDALREDQNAGAVLVNVNVVGRVKWKVGTWVSGSYNIYVNCHASFRLTGDVGPAVKLQLPETCIVDV